MAMSLPEFLHSFDSSEHERLDDQGSTRNVYRISGEYLERLAMDEEVVVKQSEPSNEIGIYQNRRETRAYLESLERNQNFLPEVKVGSSNFETVVAERVDPFTVADGGHPWFERRRRTGYEQGCKNALPEGWSDQDDLELGIDREGVKIVDGGTLFRNEWIVSDPIDHGSLNQYSIEGDEYFSIQA